MHTVFVSREQIVVSVFETLDALLREIEVDKTCRDIKLKSSICTTLAKVINSFVYSTLSNVLMCTAVHKKFWSLKKC